LAELELPDFEQEMEDVEAEAAPAQNIERTAEFAQPLATASTVASFSQSFWEGQEVPPPAQSDYNEAIDRIKADLNAADAAEFNKDAQETDPDALAAAILHLIWLSLKIRRKRRRILWKLKMRRIMN